MKHILIQNISKNNKIKLIKICKIIFIHNLNLIYFYKIKYKNKTRDKMINNYLNKNKDKKYNNLNKNIFKNKMIIKNI